MQQKISISRWNIGEASQRSIGDFEMPSYTSSCRKLRNFVISETGKAWRRPGFVHHAESTHEEVRLIPYYRRDETFIMLFFLKDNATNPADKELKFSWYKKVGGKLTLQTTIDVYTFDASVDFGSDRPKVLDIHSLSFTQIDNYTYLTHPNMEDPREIHFDDLTGLFYSDNYSTSTATSYVDVEYVVGVSPIADKWIKTVQTDFAAGGGTTLASGPVGWTPYTGLSETAKPNRQNFKYLTCVASAFQRLIFAKGPSMIGSVAGDPATIGRQTNKDVPTTTDVEPPDIIASDPVNYTISSDLGYEDLYWLAGGSLLLGGANNGAWVLSNKTTGNIDATNPLMYKATSHGAYKVQGRTVGDALLYFQRPGRIMNEFLYANATQNYTATNLSEFSDHIFYDYPPVEMEVQRSPFNVTWILREDGTLVTFTYDRQRQIYAWAVQDFNHEFGSFKHNGEVKSLCMFTDGVIDYPVIYTKRTNSDGDYYGLEMMDEYTPSDIEGVFVDAASKRTLTGNLKVLGIEEDPTGHWIEYDSSNGALVPGDTLNFTGATRTDDGVQPIVDNNYDYIFGEWIVLTHDGSADKIQMTDMTGEPYVGIHTQGEAANSYIELGSIDTVMNTPNPAEKPNYTHLNGVMCNSLLDGNPRGIYVSSTTDFYDPETFPEDWDGDESALSKELNGLHVYWNKIIIGRPYESIFAPFVMKKQVKKAKIQKIELEVFRTLGGKVGTANMTLDNRMIDFKMVDIQYPVSFQEDELYTGTIKPDKTGGFGDDPFFFIFVDEAVPFNLTNTIYFVEAN